MGGAAEVLKETELDGSENFTPAQIEKFKSDPELYRRFVKAIEKEVNNVFPIVSRPQKGTGQSLDLRWPRRS